MKNFIRRRIREEISLKDNTNIDWSSKSIKQYLEHNGFTILNYGVVRYGNIEAILWLQRDLKLDRGSLIMTEVDLSEIKIATLDFITNKGEAGDGSASIVLDKIVEGAKKTGTTIKLYPKKVGRKGLTTKELASWYEKRGFKIIEGGNGIMEFKP